MSSDGQPPQQRIVPPSRRRDKPILSCVLCRRRKLKCDRQQPCKTCVDRGLALQCNYARNIPAPAHEPKPANNVHDRIDQLEKLVTSLMGANKQGHQPSFTEENDSPWPQPTETSTNTEDTGTTDRVKLEKDAVSYTGSGHWTSILDSISELREQLDLIPTTAQPNDPTQSEIAGPDLLFGRHQHASQHELLAAIPPRSDADSLVATYFASMDMAPNILHRPTFLREYDQFWDKPFETPIMWLGLLFSIFALATRFQSVLNCHDSSYGLTDSSMYSARMALYREKSVQCLILGNYTKCPPYTLETFLQYFVAEYFRSQDSQFGVWVIVGMIVRIAFRMGYHREPSRFANITPFKAEMRRKMWAMIVQLDLMTSVQMGLPRMIQPSMYDVWQPRNLTDEDLDEKMTELPPSRPDTESTVMLYTLVRNRVLQIFARITDLTNSTVQPSYQSVMELDAALRAESERMPPSMLPVRAKDLLITNTDVAMRSLYLGLTLLKAELVLHRPFLLLGRTDSRYEYSRLACLNAALEILDFQKALDLETRPGGRLWSNKWRLWSVSWRFSSLVSLDFIIATTVLAVDLDKDLTTLKPASEHPADRVRSRNEEPTRAEIVRALTDTYEIWMHSSQTSREAKKVAAAVRLVLGKANADNDLANSSGDHGTPLSQFDFASFGQPPTSTNIPSANPDGVFFDMSNPQFVSPFPSTDPLLDMSIPGFDWNGLETTTTFPSFDNFQDAYLG